MPQMKVCGSSTFWPRVAHMGGKFGQEVVKANKSVRLSLLSAVACQHKHLERTIYIQHWDASWSFFWAGMFLDWREKRMSPCWPLSGTFHEIWHDQINIMADLWHTRTSQLAVPPPLLPPLFYSSYGPPDIFSFLICVMWAQCCRMFLRCWMDDKLRLMLTFLEILQLHLHPEDPGFSFLCKWWHHLSRLFIFPCDFSSCNLFFCHV